MKAAVATFEVLSYKANCVDVSIHGIFGDSSFDSLDELIDVIVRTDFSIDVNIKIVVAEARSAREGILWFGEHIDKLKEAFSLSGIEDVFGMRMSAIKPSWTS
jgi:hypothetical protein